MKALLKLIFVLIVSVQLHGQGNEIETKSIKLDDFISFIANNYTSQNTLGESLSDEEPKFQNRTFLIETSPRNLSKEDAIILKQAFKFLSKRLNEQDQISIIAYSGINGLVLEKTSPKNLKKILNVLNDFKSNIDKPQGDGIAFAYTFATNKFEEQAENTVVMIRNPDAKNNIAVTNINETGNADVTKQKNNIVLLSALALLPELISIIKD